jgi:hypothetical protein
MSKRYRYVGPGQGVPGLPHELDDEEARRLGVHELLEQALQAKVYEAIAEKAKGKTPAEESD